VSVYPNLFAPPKKRLLPVNFCNGPNDARAMFLLSFISLPVSLLRSLACFLSAICNAALSFAFLLSNCLSVSRGPRPEKRALSLAPPPASVSAPPAPPPPTSPKLSNDIIPDGPMLGPLSNDPCISFLSIKSFSGLDCHFLGATTCGCLPK